MTGTETEIAKAWGGWLTARLRARGWSVDDLVGALGGSVSRTQAYRWYRGDQVPTRENAGLVADALSVDRRQAYLNSGHEVDPETPIVTDPAEAFIQQIRARRLPRAVEERLIAETRAEIEQRRRQLEQTLDIVETAVELRREDPEPV